MSNVSEFGMDAFRKGQGYVEQHPRDVYQIPEAFTFTGNGEIDRTTITHCSRSTGVATPPNKGLQGVYTGFRYPPKVKNAG